MKIDLLQPADIPQLNSLQPVGWPPIIPYYEFYTRTRYCHPLKYVANGQIAGIGSSIEHKGTAWLAHIIVREDFRRQGIGKAITSALMDNLMKRRRVRSIHLVATPMGEPLYQQLGFRRLSEYVFLRGGKTIGDAEISFETCHPGYREAGLAIDRDTASEDRRDLLEPHWNHACFTKNGSEITGFYMPGLGEGFIVATTPEAGLALLRRKHASGAPGVIPEENRHAIACLEANGFMEYRRGARMAYGQPVSWHPERIYGRIGGNLG